MMRTGRVLRVGVVTRGVEGRGRARLAVARRKRRSVVVGGERAWRVRAQEVWRRVSKGGVWGVGDRGMVWVRWPFIIAAGGEEEVVVVMGVGWEWAR